MALQLRKAMLEISNPVTQLKRFRGKINVQKPKLPHFERLKYIELTKPYFINSKKLFFSKDLCQLNEVPVYMRKDNNIFQNIIAGELLRWFQASKLVAFFHMNPMDADQQYKAYVLFKNQKMHYKNYGKSTLEIAVKGTPYQAVLEFYASHNMTVFSPEIKLKELFRITKKFPQLILLAGICEGKFLSKDDLVKYNSIPNLASAQAELVHTLHLASTSLSTHLNSHQNTLVTHLEERRKQLEDLC